jgi:GT2 family glycosyltransferase
MCVSRTDVTSHKGFATRHTLDRSDMLSQFPPLSAVASDRRVRRVSDRVAAAVRGLVPDSRRAVADSLAFGAVVTAVLAVGYLKGAVVVTLPVPPPVASDPVVVPQAVVACLSIAGLFCCSALVLFGQLARSATDESLPADGQQVAAVVPVHRDAAALHRSVESLLASSYEDLHVYVVAEPGDRPSIRRAREYTTDDRVTLLVNTRYTGSKAGAINYAAEETDEACLAVFDADERVHPQFVASAVAELDDCDVVQGRTLPEPDGAVETVAYYESVLLGDLSKRLLTTVTDFTMAASRAVVLRRGAFERVGGYDPAMLTEDYDFAFRCYEAGLSVREQLAYASTIEGAHTATDWWGQRKRWMTGYAQVFHDLFVDWSRPGPDSNPGPKPCPEPEQDPLTATRADGGEPVRTARNRGSTAPSGPSPPTRPAPSAGSAGRVDWTDRVERRLRNYRTLLSPVVCGASVVGNLFLLSLVSKAAVLVQFGALAWFALPVATLASVALALRVHDTRVGRLDGHGVGIGWLLAPAVLPLYGLVAVKATVEYPLSWDGEWYSVAKGA